MDSVVDANEHIYCYINVYTSSDRDEDTYAYPATYSDGNGNIHAIINSNANVHAIQHSDQDSYGDLVSNRDLDSLQYTHEDAYRHLDAIQHSD